MVLKPTMPPAAECVKAAPAVGRHKSEVTNWDAICARIRKDVASGQKESVGGSTSKTDF